MSTAGDESSSAKVEDNEMSTEDWNLLWDEGTNLGFHRDHLHPAMQKHRNDLLEGRENIRILFPLCGKCVDMKWLADMGHQVVGVEGSEKALKEFFTEQGLEYSTEPAQGMPGTLYKSKDSKIRLYNGDFFDFSSSVDGKFDAIWDKASLVAVNRLDTERYVDLITSLMAPGCSYLLLVVTYDETKYGGPPHSYSEEQIHQLFDGKCWVETLDEQDVFEPRHASWGGISSVIERVYKITLK